MIRTMGKQCNGPLDRSDRCPPSENNRPVLSPFVMTSMLEETSLQQDEPTFKLIIDQASSMGEDGRKVVLKTLQKALEQLDWARIDIVLDLCLDHESLSPPFWLISRVASRAVSFMKWDTAKRSVQYMLQSGMPVQERIMFNLLGGLLGNSDRAHEVLDIVIFVMKYSREECMKFIPFSGVSIFFGCNFLCLTRIHCF